MDKSEKYHPSLFSREQETPIEVETEPVIPQATLYDTPVQTQHAPAKKHVVLFGFTPANKANVLEQISKIMGSYRKEEGKNYIKIWASDSSSLDEILKLNHTAINGEIIGVYRQNFGVIDDESIYVKKKGIFRMAYEYLFGQ